MKFPQLDFRRIETYPLRNRTSKVRLEHFAQPWRKGKTFRTFLNSLPKILAGNDFRDLVAAVSKARRNGKPVILCLGAHPIKCGLGPVLIDLMRRGIISCLATNGAAAIHDFEVALVGQTSEDVQSGLDDGSFGMADETGRSMNAAMLRGLKRHWGAGRAIGEAILSGRFPHKTHSIFATAVRLKIPATIHIAIGTDITHQHPTTNGAVLGEASYIDFRTFAGAVAALDEGGVLLNLGSAVVLPEVFLKALTIARNLGHRVENFTTATFDMIRLYRPAENIVRRPTHKSGRGYYFIGHHEIMFPLFAAAVVEAI